MNTLSLFTYIRMYTYAHTRTHACMHTRTHTHTLIQCIYIYCFSSCAATDVVSDAEMFESLSPPQMTAVVARSMKYLFKNGMLASTDMIYHGSRVGFVVGFPTFNHQIVSLSLKWSQAFHTNVLL